ncbi:hypothetical protein [Ensifer sp. 22564]|uniref:hypothetical protein n=1 Tax=Ensifer sp. 22564 TaxID=3453943 RepID=UPI003F85F303
MFRTIKAFGPWRRDRHIDRRQRTVPRSRSQVESTIVLMALLPNPEAGVARLTKDGYVAIAAANPLRSVASDAVSVAAVVRAIDRPGVLVSHSYGGPIITEAAKGNP